MYRFNTYRKSSTTNAGAYAKDLNGQPVECGYEVIKLKASSEMYRHTHGSLPGFHMHLRRVTLAHAVISPGSGRLSATQ